MRTVENSRRRIKTKTIIENIAGAYVHRMSIESSYVTTCNSIAFERFSVEGRKCIKKVV